MQQLSTTIKLDEFNKFIECVDLKYDMPLSIDDYISINIDNIDLVKEEISTNIFSIESHQIPIYLNAIKSPLKEKLTFNTVSRNDFIEHLNKYNISIEDLSIRTHIADKDLNKLLSAKAISTDGKPNKNLDANFIEEQHFFFNFYYGEAIRAILNFIEQILTIQSPAIETSPQVIKNQYKIKTSLSAAELGYFFKKLEQEGVIIIDKGEAESFYRTIANTFELSEKGDFQSTTFKNNFTSTELELKTIEKLHQHFIRLSFLTQKDK